MLNFTSFWHESFFIRFVISLYFVINCHLIGCLIMREIPGKGNRAMLQRRMAYSVPFALIFGVDIRLGAVIIMLMMPTGQSAKNAEILWYATLFTIYILPMIIRAF